jgi:branched-chain amino acid aminotransferase
VTDAPEVTDAPGATQTPRPADAPGATDMPGATAPPRVSDLPRSDWPIVLDGKLMRLGEATIPAGDDGLIRGDGAFDAFPLRGGRPFARGAHLDRLQRSCSAIALECPRAAIESDVDLLLSSSNPADGVVRVILTRGGHRLCILESLGDRDALSRPARLLPVTYSPSVVLNGVKTLSYGANMQASRQAVAAGYDEALLVGPDGTVLEGPTCSIFWVTEGRLRTPALETGILASITRRVVIENLSVEEGAFAQEDLLAAQEAFLASTARSAQPVAAIGDRPLPVCPGPQTLRAQETLERVMAAGSIA